MLPLHASLDALSDAGAALDAIVDEIRGTMRSTAERLDDLPIPAGWSTAGAMLEAIESAGATVACIAGTIEAIRDALHRTAYEYAAADQRSARRQVGPAW